MEKNRGLHLVYKELGETPYEAILRFKTHHPEYVDVSVTYAGRLDPMAEGLLLLLSGDEVHEKETYLGLSKTYEVEILWGFETDTLDALGMVTQKDTQEIPESKLIKTMNGSVGSFEQLYPAYSSKPVDGKPLFMWAREGKLNEIQIPSHAVELQKITHVARKTVLGSDLLQKIEDKISKVRGDFRQEEILKTWKEKLSSSQETYTIDTVSLSVSSGFYVRQFVSDLAKSLGTCAIAFHIKRTEVGNFSVQNIGSMVK